MMTSYAKPPFDLFAFITLPRPSAMASRIIRLTPSEYVHVLDSNSNITRVEVGPQTFTRKDHEEICLGPEKLVMVPSGSYCVVLNPVLRDEDDALVYNEYGQVKLRHGAREVRLAREPFPLYPGEQLVQSVVPLQLVPANEALHLRASQDFEHTLEDGTVIIRRAGDEWLFEGPGTFIPRPEVDKVADVSASVLMPNTALQLRARRTFTDRTGVTRLAGEEWLLRELDVKAAEVAAGKRKKGGAYLPAVEEEVLRVVEAYVLTDKRSLHLSAKRTFVDVYGITRKAGSEWLVTTQLSNSHIPDVNEAVVGPVEVTTLTNRQYCIVQQPVDASLRPQLGMQEVRTNTSFFLHPGESLMGGVQPVHVLAEGEALLLSAGEDFVDVDGTAYHAGSRWMLHGPCDYIPPMPVTIVEKRKVLPLDKNEGIYVRDTRSGTVRAVVGVSYLLQPNEVLWEKKMPAVVDKLLGRVGKDLTRVVSFPVPHNSAIYDFKSRVARVVFGPELAMLQPDEQFTVLSLSGGKPKKGHQIQSIRLALGPDFSTDIITVETLDHARLELQLSYNWQFEVDKTDPASAAKLFAVPDFVGDICKLIGSRVRSAVAATTFDDFHRSSAKIIRSSVFGVDETGKVRGKLLVEANNVAIINIDIQAIEPVDQSTRDSLQKSVYMAIEITTKSQEAAARHEGQRNDQASGGRLERQRIVDEVQAERERMSLLSLQAESAAVEATGQAVAEARARAESALIEATAAVKQAELKAEARKIEFDAEQQLLQVQREGELRNLSETNNLEVNKAKQLASIETLKFKSLVSSITPETIKAMAAAGPEAQAKLLAGLGLKGYVVTDGSSPINLFNTANGMIGMPPTPPAPRAQ
ncbi:hypothetical protein AB1Y20_012266 [Prymnesium parvum]|uniref:Major vault protein n=1 Tax=Prymnesium parvum TaxID=97485 RepID=A0AB34IRM6_PRYPA